MPQPVPLLLVVDDTPYEVDLAAIDAEQVRWMRTDLGVSPADLVSRLEAGTAELPEVVALMAVSLQQADQPADLAWLSKRVTLGSTVEITYEDADAPNTSPDLAALADALRPLL